MKLLLYCTKAKPYLVKRNIFAGVEPSYFTLKENVEDKLNGTIIAECDFEVEKITKSFKDDSYADSELLTICDKSCLSTYKLINYASDEFGFKLHFYVIHIKNLHIFDKPKELSEYYSSAKKLNTFEGFAWVNVSIDKAPQNMMHAYEYHSEMGFSGTLNQWLEKEILISIQPQWLCKILNGEKTIEVRKKVLKEMIK